MAGSYGTQAFTTPITIPVWVATELKQLQGSQSGQGVSGCVVRPLTDRGQGAGFGQHRAQTDQDDVAQAVASAPPIATIGLFLGGCGQGEGVLVRPGV